jgi:hypothetical protein
MKIALVSVHTHPVVLGLRYISSCLKVAGYGVELLFMFPRRSVGPAGLAAPVLDAFAERCRQADLVGMGLMTGNYQRACVLTDSLRQAGIKAPILWGGTHPTVAPLESLQTADKRLVVLAIVPVGLLSVASCNSESKKPRVQTSSAVAAEEGVPGGKVVQTQTLVATVDHVRKSTREVTLLMADGSKSIIKCGPEVRDFGQIGKGDRVTVQSTQELNVFMATGAEPAGNAVAVGRQRVQ